MVNFILEEDKEEKTLRLVLKKDGDNVALWGYDETGERWFIMSFRSDGTFWRAGSIPKDIGLQVDESGIIKES